MKLRDLSISRQLGIGLTTILLLVLVLGAIAYVQTNSLWRATEGLYSHPLMVRRALGELRADVLSMRIGMQELVSVADEAHRQGVRQRIDTLDADAHRQLETIRERYLGPMQDVTHIADTLASWKVVREDTWLLLRQGNVAEARGHTEPTGVCSAQLARVLAEIDDVSRFAAARGDAFYRDAERNRQTLEVYLGVLLIAILALTGTISSILIRGIRRPLRELTATAEALRQGNLAARTRQRGDNEFGVLADALNMLADTVQAEIGHRESVNRIADQMLREEELHRFTRSVLQALLTETGSQVGALYLRNPQGTVFEHCASIGLAEAGRKAFSAVALEGEFGTALATRQIQHLRDIPEDTRFAFVAVTGDFRPRAVLTVPILSGTEVIAMISLASVRDYSPAALRLVEDVWGVLTARLNGVLAYRHIQEVSARLESQNQELGAQKRELAAQTDELSEQNIELSLQKKQLDEANRLKNVFLSNMSHELRTPLNSVIALAGVLRRRLRTTIPDEEAGFLEIIERNGQALLALINDVLDLSRIEAGKEEIRIDRFSVRSLADDIVAMLGPQAREKNISLVNGVGDDLPVLASDLDKCRHILQNLVGNAVKFTLQGKVEISARQEEGLLCLAVADTGIGIAPEHLPHIFEEFRQGDEGTARRFGGTGLGLAIAKRYAHLLGGTISVVSTPGQGSTFTVRLPLSLPALSADDLAPARSSRPAEPAVTGGTPASGARILLVEDSEAAIIQVTDALREQGYEVQVARNGREALARIRDASPDAMILDLMMPEVDGFEVLRQIRAVPETAQLPVLILTAKHVTREELSFLKHNHVKQLIQKGDINRSALLAHVADMVHRKARPAPVPQPKRPPPTGTPKILVVEDNPDNRTTIRALLRERHTVIEAADGQTGFDEAQTHNPDLILLDLAMPGMDGFAVLLKIREHETLRHTPVVALTARAMKGDREDILKYGFDAYLAKPIDADLLTRTLKELLYG